MNKSLFTFQTVLAIMLKSGFLFADNKFSNRQECTLFNVSYLFLGLKELISNLEFIHNSPEGRVYIYIEHSYTRYLAKALLGEFKFLSKFVKIIRFSRELVESDESTTLLILFGSQKKSFFYEAIRKKILFIHVINSKKSLPITGVFQMYTNIPNMMKTVFIFALINSVFSKNKVEKIEEEIKPVVEDPVLVPVVIEEPKKFEVKKKIKKDFKKNKELLIKKGFSSPEEKQKYHAEKRYAKKQNAIKNSENKT